MGARSLSPASPDRPITASPSPGRRPGPITQDQFAHRTGWSSWSPTGDRITFKISARSGNPVDADLYVMNADGSGQTLLRRGNPVPAGTTQAAGTAWSPDATMILFSSITGTGTSQLFTIPVAGGSATPRPATAPGRPHELDTGGVATSCR
jgi:Tol biopolymer transport system component